MNSYTRSNPPQPDAASVPQEPRRYTAYHDVTGPARLTTTVVHVVADIAGADVSTVHTEIGTALDLDALDRLFTADYDSRSAPQGHLRFPVWHYEVTIHADGRIVVEEPLSSG